MNVLAATTEIGFHPIFAYYRRFDCRGSSAVLLFDASGDCSGTWILAGLFS